MEQQLYCVYNQTSECFLSLGVTHQSSALTRLKGVLAGRAQRHDEVNWVDRPKSRDLFLVVSSRDLVFLDDKHRVVGAIESFAPFRFAPIGPNVESVLALPERTIYSSQTQPGNQLVVCVAEEMEFRLRSVPDLQKYELCDFPLDADSLQATNPNRSPRIDGSRDVRAGRGSSPTIRPAAPWKCTGQGPHAPMVFI